MTEALGAYIKNRISVTEEELNTILSYFVPLKLRKNQILLSQGELSQRTFLW